jgi:aminoglycoside phosphotransferase (APT) family kinase protein
MALFRGLRRDLLRRSRACEATGDALSAISLARSAELLTDLALRYQGLPQLLLGHQPQLRLLLQDSIDQVRVCAGQIPDEVLRVAHEAPPSHGDDVVTYHDELCRAISLCMATAAREPAEASHRLRQLHLLKRLCHFQRSVAEAREAALDALRRQHALDGDGSKESPSPSLLSDTLQRYLPAYPNARVTNVSRLPGLNANEVFALEVEGIPGWPRECILRRNRASEWVGNQVSREYGVLSQVFETGIPVPQPLLAGNDLDGQNRPFIILSRVPGEAVPLASMGVSAASFLRDAATTLARIHQVPTTGLSEQYALPGETARERTLNMVQRYHDAWHAEYSEQSLVLEAAYAWLRTKVDVVDERQCLVHGDYSQRNILSDNGRLTAVLDWELAHLGHPAEDLGYIRLDVEEVMPWKDFMRAYVDAGGFDVEDEVIRYFRIYGAAFQMATQSVAGKRFMDDSLPDLLIGSVATFEWRESDRKLCEWLLAELNASV